MQRTRHLYLIIFISLIPYLLYGQADSEVISDYSYYQVKGNKLTLNSTTTIQINNRMGDHSADISIAYSKGDKLSIDGAWIEDMDGNIIRKIKSKEITERSYISDMSLYEDDLLKSFELKHNVYPYRVVYSYTITFNRFMTIASFNYERAKTPVNLGILCVEVPEGYPIAYTQQNMDAPKIETSNGSAKYCWNYQYDASAALSEINSSINQVKAPFVKVVPTRFIYGLEGSQESWGDFGNWLYNLNKGRDKLPFQEEKKIDDLLEGIVSDRDKARVLYKYLQDNNRYINVSIDLGGLQTYPASYVVANRYGDCKALTNYMQAMLNYAGIRSHYTLIKAGDKVRDIDHDFASQVFNHVILTVPFENDTVYLECTSKNAPFGYLGTFTQGREALLIDSLDCRFITTPSLKPDDVLCSRSIEADLSTSAITFKAVERGDKYETSSYLANNATKSKIDKYIRDHILSGSFDLLGSKLQNSPDSAQITIISDCNMHNPLSKKYGKNIMINPFPIRIDSYETPALRTTDVQVDYPEYYKDTIVYKLGDIEVGKLPENMMVKTKYGVYSVSYTFENGELIQSKFILIVPGRYPVEEYEAFYKFVSGIKNYELKNIYIETL